MLYFCLKCADQRPGPGRCRICGCKVLSETELAQITDRNHDLAEAFLKGEGSCPPSSYSFVYEGRRS